MLYYLQLSIHPPPCNIPSPSCTLSPSLLASQPRQCIANAPPVAITYTWTHDYYPPLPSTMQKKKKKKKKKVLLTSPCQCSHSSPLCTPGVRMYPLTFFSRMMSPCFIPSPSPLPMHDRHVLNCLPSPTVTTTCCIICNYPSTHHHATFRRHHAHCHHRFLHRNHANALPMHLPSRSHTPGRMTTIHHYHELCRRRRRRRRRRRCC